MPSRPADVRRDYRLHLQIGAALALLLVLGAFTFPATPPREMLVVTPRVDPIPTLIPPTDQAPPPPPPPPAAPPPVEVENERVIEDVVIPDLIMDFTTDVTTAGPPAPPAPPPLPQPIETFPPPPPPVEDMPEDPNHEFLVVEQQPVLIGGLEELQRRVEYPRMARDAGAEGNVIVQFVVERDGSVSDATVLRSPNALLSEAALAAVRESRFEPGHQRGIPVRVRYTLPVRFVLR